jgi:hypothetical protein
MNIGLVNPIFTLRLCGNAEQAKGNAKKSFHVD